MSIKTEKLMGTGRALQVMSECPDRVITASVLAETIKHVLKMVDLKIEIILSREQLSKPMNLRFKKKKKRKKSEQG